MTLNHVHTYKRLEKGYKQSDPKFMCKDPHCTYKQKRSLLRGKAALCNGCREEFVLDNYSLKTAEPKCLKCRQTSDAVKLQGTISKIEDLFGEKELSNDI